MMESHNHMHAFIKKSALALAIGFGLTSFANAQEADQNSSAQQPVTTTNSSTSSAASADSDTTARTVDTVIVTGTHVSNRTAVQSQSPIDIITPKALEATGTSELATALSRVLPTLNFPRPAMADGTSGVRPAQLRGLSPDQVLVLVNGKRRHVSALVNVNGTMGRGSSAVDLNAIPIAAIKRVEVLRDGASAQYGSDAIAGVVNIVLKGAGEGGSISTTYGKYNAGDGARADLDASSGVTFAHDRAKLDVAAQVTKQDATNRSGAYTGTAPNTSNFPGVGEKRYIVGDPRVTGQAVSANGSFVFNESLNAYATVIASNRDVDSYAFYRSRDHQGQSALLAQFYPTGYVPVINQFVQDRSAVVGLQGTLGNDFNWDASYNYGHNSIDYTSENTINYSLGANSPRRFYDGNLQYTQHIVNINGTKPFQLASRYASTFSVGAEYRREEWMSIPGAPDSYFGSGSQGFTGFTAKSAVDARRHNYAVFSGLETDFTDKFSTSIGARFEDYSDFGKNTAGKVSARYAFNDKIALRGTYSTGFRAPSLAQQSYSSVNTYILNGEEIERGTFPPSSAMGVALGEKPLKAERANSASVGLIITPIQRLYMTLDAYQIDIKNRIVYSSTIKATPALLSRLSGMGLPGVETFSYFTNLLGTRTRGADLVTTYSIPFSTHNTLDLSASYTYNKTTLNDPVPPPSPLFVQWGIQSPLVGRDELGRIEDTAPRNKSVLSANWTLNRWSFNLTGTYYGSYTVRSAAGPSLDQTFGGRWLVDTSVNFHPTDQWTLTVGADNVFDTYPEKITAARNSYYGVMPYSNYSPFGFNGAFAYVRVGYHW